MSRLDRCHQALVAGLEKDGWQVSSHPFPIVVPSHRPLLADIRAIQDTNEILIVEVKCFPKETLDELYTAVGQYLVYRNLMRKMEIPYPLYLAVPAGAYHRLIQPVVKLQNNFTGAQKKYRQN